MKIFKLSVLSFCLCASTSFAVFADEAEAAKSSPTSVETPQSTAVQQVTAAEMAEILGIPAPVFASNCSATNTSCPDGCPISCTGTSSCTVGANTVTCDGVTKGCLYPSCSPGLNCTSPAQKCEFCDCRASGGTIRQCACALN